MRVHEVRSAQVAPRQIKSPSFKLTRTATSSEDGEDCLNISSRRILGHTLVALVLIRISRPRRISTHVCRKDFHNRPMVTGGVECKPFERIDSTQTHLDVRFPILKLPQL